MAVQAGYAETRIGSAAVALDAGRTGAPVDDRGRWIDILSRDADTSGYNGES